MVPVRVGRWHRRLDSIPSPPLLLSHLPPSHVFPPPFFFLSHLPPPPLRLVAARWVQGCGTHVVVTKLCVNHEAIPLQSTRHRLVQRPRRVRHGSVIRKRRGLPMHTKVHKGTSSDNNIRGQETLARRPPARSQHWIRRTSWTAWCET